MFRVAPIRVSMWRAGSMMLELSLIAALLGVCTGLPTSPGMGTPALLNGPFWGVFVIECAAICASGWLGASGTWSKWRRGALARAVAVAQAPTTDAVLTWTMKQLAFGALFLVAGIWLSTGIADTGEGESKLIATLAIGLGAIGMNHLIQAWRVGKLERAQSVVYYWQRQPGVLEFTNVNVCAVPAYAVVW